MSSPRTHATFFATGFNTPGVSTTTPSVDPTTYGDDVALRLALGLREAGLYARAPYCEDWGWCVEFEVLGTRHWLGVGQRNTVVELLGDAAPDVANGGATQDWVCFVERSWSLRDLLHAARERHVTANAAAAVHAVLVAMPEVTGLLWHHQEHFDAGDESRGSPEP